MKIPVYSFTEVVNALVAAGNGNALAGFDLKRIAEIKKSIPIEMSDIERKFDSQTNHKLFEQILLSHQIRALMMAIIEERNMKFFEELERLKRKDELERYLKSKMDGEGFSDEAQEKILELARNNEAIQFYIEKIVALEALIKELESQNEILIAMRDEFVEKFVKDLGVELRKDPVFNEIPEGEDEGVLREVLDVMHAARDDFNKKKELKENYNQKKPTPPPQKEHHLFFLHNQADHKEQSEYMIAAGSMKFRTIFDSRRIVYDENAPYRLANSIFKDNGDRPGFESFSQTLEVIKESINANVSKIEDTRREADSMREKLGSDYKKLSSAHKELDRGHKELGNEKDRFAKAGKGKTEDIDLLSLVSDASKYESVSPKKGPKK